MRTPDPRSIGWVDGRFCELGEARITIDDPAFHAGLGLYETFGVRNGIVLEMDEHLQRLEEAADQVRIALPSLDELRSALRELANRAVDRDGWVKIVVTRGGRRVAFGASVDLDREAEPASAILLPWRRNLAGPLCGLKTLNYAANVLGLEEARRRDADEGIWLNTRGHLAEGCQSNLFVVQRRKLFTPSVRDGILAGIVRGIVLDAARRIGLTIHEGKTRLRRLEQASEAFFTSSVRGIRPLVRYEAKPVGNGRPGPVTRELATEVERIRVSARQD